MDAKEIAEILTAREKTVSVAEADTAGLIGYMLGAIPGSSKYFPGGIIAYTGGFTDCLLQRGARHVYAVDVGHGQMDYGLRQDQRVTVMEKTNARHPFDLPEQVGLVVMDVSFISLTMVIPEAIRHLDPGRYVAALVKPQFEALKSQVGRGGVIKDPRVHADVLGKTVNWAVEHGLRFRNMCRSPIQGDAGNREFFILLQKPED